MLNLLKSYWPFITATFILLIVITISSIYTFHNIGGFTYPMDDTYIHMSIAKNFVNYGTWGVTKYHFSSSSSSLLWTLIIAMSYYIYGVGEITPLIINIVFAILLLISCFIILKHDKIPANHIFIILLGIIFMNPLPSIVFLGMEHVLQIIICLWFFFLAATILSRKESEFKAADYGFWLVTPLLTLIRYEGLFVAFTVCILFMIQRRWFYSCFIGFLALLPVGSYGIISILQGWFWLPNSVVLKGGLPAMTNVSEILTFLSQTFLKLVFQFAAAPYILLLCSLILSFYLYLRKENGEDWNKYRIMGLIWVATAVLHLQFARIGWIPGVNFSFFRYEAYLLAIGILVIGVILSKYYRNQATKTGKMSRFISVLTVIALVSMATLGIKSLIIVPQAIKNIYEQQYQMAQFLKKFYAGMPVAANDIGAINYFTDIKCLDLWGLESIEVATMKRNNSFRTEYIYNLAKSKDIKVAIVYDQWFSKYGGVPHEWIKVGQWQIKNNLVCGHDTISFYAVDPSEEQRLIFNLKAFSSNLPVEVKQSGKYLESPG